MEAPPVDNRPRLREGRSNKLSQGVACPGGCRKAEVEGSSPGSAISSSIAKGNGDDEPKGQGINGGAGRKLKCSNCRKDKGEGRSVGIRGPRLGSHGSAK